MIIIIEGKIGSGKTYFAVNYILKKFFRFDDSILDYVPLKDVKIVTNIDNLQLKHVSLEKEMLEGGYSVFSMEYVKKYPDQNVVYIVDDASNIFDRKFFNKDVFKFFQMSRHEGVDILLITQDIYTLSRELQNLAERTVYAVQRSMRTKNTFVYKFKVDGGTTGISHLNFDQKVALLYKSRSKEELEKTRFEAKKYIITGLVAVVMCVIAFMFFVNWWKGTGSVQAKEMPLKKNELVSSVRVMSKEEIEKIEKRKDDGADLRHENAGNPQAVQEVKEYFASANKNLNEKHFPGCEGQYEVEHKDEKTGAVVKTFKKDSYPDTVFKKIEGGMQIYENGRLAGEIRVNE